MTWESCNHSVCLLQPPPLVASNTRVRDAAALLRRIAQSEGDGTLASALFTEAAANANIRAMPPRVRKAAALYTLAGEGPIVWSVRPCGEF